MSRISIRRILKTTPATAIALALATLSVGIGLAAQDTQTLQVPNGLAFSEFEGYDTWQDVAVSETKGSVKAILANPAMISAYKEGIPGNGKLFPEGSKVVKIEWVKKRNAVSPYFVEVPDVLKSLSFIVKDSKRFPNTHGWAFAQFDYDAASDTFRPSVTGAECGYACHSRVASQDYIFTAYPKR
jgi:cytochrome P460